MRWPRSRSFLAKAKVTFRFACQYSGAMTMLAMVLFHRGYGSFRARCLLMPQGLDRFNPGCAPGRKIAGHNDDSEQKSQNAHKNGRVCGFDPKQHALQHPG